MPPRICSINEVLQLPPWMNAWMQSEAQRCGINAAVMLVPPDNRLSQSGTLLTKQSLEAAGVPVLMISADMVDAHGWSHERMVEHVGPTFEQQTSLYRCLQAAEPEFDRELHGLDVLAVQGGNLPGIVTRSRPVRTLDDLRGLRLRAPSELLGVLADLGADPVDLPMGEVYSALAKGVLDGVVAPADTLRSLHFGEVAHYFNTIRIPRGAYASRAMGKTRWNQLTAAQHALLERSVAIWEAALASEIGAAEHAGEVAGRERGVQFFDMSPADQRRFDEIYERDAERHAREIARDGIDAMTSFRRARAIANG